MTGKSLPITTWEVNHWIAYHKIRREIEDEELKKSSKKGKSEKDKELDTSIRPRRMMGNNR